MDVYIGPDSSGFGRYSSVRWPAAWDGSGFGHYCQERRKLCTRFIFRIV